MEKPLELAEVIMPRSEEMEWDAHGESLFTVEIILDPHKRCRGYQWLTLMKEEQNHVAELQPTRDFKDVDETMTAAFKEYIKEHGLLQRLLDQSDRNDFQTGELGQESPQGGLRGDQRKQRRNSATYWSRMRRTGSNTAVS